MPRIHFNPEISLGNVLTILGGVVVLIAGWTTMQNDMRYEREMREKIEARIQKLQDRDDMIMEQIKNNQHGTVAELAKLNAQMGILLSRLQGAGGSPR